LKSNRQEKNIGRKRRAQHILSDRLDMRGGGKEGRYSMRVSDGEACGAERRAGKAKKEKDTRVSQMRMIVAIKRNLGNLKKGGGEKRPICVTGGVDRGKRVRGGKGV